jgi:hypothetical protein
MGWPLQLAALAVMVWLLARDATPVIADQEDHGLQAGQPGRSADADAGSLRRGRD